MTPTPRTPKTTGTAGASASANATSPLAPASASAGTAAAAGCRTLVLTNGCGGLRPEWAPGTAVLISDHINLTGTSLSRDVLERLRSAVTPGMVFHISERAVSPGRTFNNLEEALQFWCNEAGREHTEIPHPTIPAHKPGMQSSR